MKKISTDALRWQLERILIDRTSSGVDPTHHARANRIYAELWRIFFRVDSRWPPDDDESLAAQGWSEQDRRHLAGLWEQHRDSPQISLRQIEACRDRFGFEPTSSNLDKVRRTIFSARTAACTEATKHLGQHAGDLDPWVEDALADSSLFAFDDEADVAKAPPAPPAPDDRPAAASQTRTRGGMLLKEAARQCIRAHVNAGAWSTDTVEQVNTAIRLFDFTCGGDVMIEDLVQKHVEDFYELCAKMPNPGANLGRSWNTVFRQVCAMQNNSSGTARRIAWASARQRYESIGRGSRRCKNMPMTRAARPAIDRRCRSD